MEIRELIKIVKEEKEKDETKIKERKNNISSNYQLAKLDFTVIDNLMDSSATLSTICEELERLQQRIIKRNKGE